VCGNHGKLSRCGQRILIRMRKKLKFAVMRKLKDAESEIFTGDATACFHRKYVGALVILEATGFSRKYA